MSAYVIADVDVTDPERYEEYKALSGPSIAAYGGRFIARGGACQVLEGDWQPNRVVLVAFDTVEQARTWYGSPEYTKARGVREGAAVGRLIVVEGVD